MSGSSNVMSAEWPSFESWPSLPSPYGLLMFRTPRSSLSAASTSATTALNSGSRTEAFLFCTITLSETLSGKFCETAVSARPDSPMP